MERQVTLRVIVESPPGDVDFGIQEGHGNDYKTVQKQRYMKQDLRFEFLIRVREAKNGQPNFLGSFARKVLRIIVSSISTSVPTQDRQTHRGVVD
jgi:hypothetical protein